LEVLEFAHSEGVVHRDIKPENILFMERHRRIMVADFGLATVNSDPNEEEKAYILGSPLYVSPEQARGEQVDGRADLFSLGCVLLECTLGFLPAKVERPEKIFNTRARESPDMFSGTAVELLPTTPEPWSDFLAKTLAPSRDKRFPNAVAMREALKELNSLL
jgi:serine/threonine-protein kinase